jgi:hypothetical protein
MSRCEIEKQWWANHKTKQNKKDKKLKKNHLKKREKKPSKSGRTF